MPIPFIKAMGNNRRRISEVSRPDQIEDLAHLFLGAGGRYLIETLKSGQVHLIALADVPSEDARHREPQAIYAIVCDNSDELMDAVDLLVRKSVEKMPPPKEPTPKLRLITA